MMKCDSFWWCRVVQYSPIGNHNTSVDNTALKNYMFTTIDLERAFDKAQHIFIWKNP